MKNPTFNKFYSIAGFRVQIERFPHGCDARRWWTGYRLNRFEIKRGRRWFRLSLGGYRLPLWTNNGPHARHIGIGDFSISWATRSAFPS